jgi:antitoxin component of RelBE/YafQ-DinJ toxin-antitoxin module
VKDRYIVFRLESVTRDALAAYAARHGITLSEAIRRAVDCFLKNNQVGGDEWKQRGQNSTR